jgi:hypothetical protein
MKNLTEKVIKTDRVRRGFADVVNSLYGGYEDKALQKANKLIKKDSNLKYEVKPHLQDIMKYIRDMYVVLEFECYLEVSEYDEDEENYDYEPPILCLEDITDDEIYDTLTAYFSYYDNISPYRNLDSAHANYITKKLKEHGEDIVTDDMIRRSKNEIPIEDFISEKFSNLLELVNSYNFRNPKYGWENDDSGSNCIYTEYPPDPKERLRSKDDRMNEIADVISKKLNIERNDIEVSVYDNIDNKDPDTWYVETDGSIHDEDDYLAVEIVTADLPITRAIRIVKEFREKVFKRFNGYTNKSVGAHINIRLPYAISDYDVDEKPDDYNPIDMLKAVVLTNDPVWADQFDRVDNKWATSQYMRIERACRELEDGLNVNEVIDRVKRKVSTKKYNSINFGKDNMLEFRFPGNNYLGNDEMFEAYLETIKWCVFMSVLAIHPDLFRQEFLARMMKLYMKSRKPVDEPDMDERLKQWKGREQPKQLRFPFMKTRDIKRKPIPF